MKDYAKQEWLNRKPGMREIVMEVATGIVALAMLGFCIYVMSNWDLIKEGVF